MTAGERVDNAQRDCGTAAARGCEGDAMRNSATGSMMGRIMGRTWALRLLAPAAVLLSAGCAMHVNIPAQAHQTARHDPNIASVIETMGRSVEAVSQRWPGDDPWQLELPAGASAETYAIVAAWAPDRITAVELGEGAGVLTVTSVRILGTEAEVDLLRPTVDGPRQLVTVYFQQRAFGPWRVHRVRAWRLPAESLP
jgi:hypothetical protein